MKTNREQSIHTIDSLRRLIHLLYGSSTNLLCNTVPSTVHQTSPNTLGIHMWVSIIHLGGIVSCTLNMIYYDT